MYECFCAIPSVEDGYKNTATSITVPDHDGSRNLGDVIICSGLCCIIDSCHCRFPACLGCYEKRICLCLEDECIPVKPKCCETRENQDLLCILLKGHQSIVMPTTCCKLVSHTFFWDRRMALPCDDDVPCVYTYFPCCTCCVNGQCSLACCTTINQVTIRNRGGSGGNGQYVNAQTVSPR